MSYLREARDFQRTMAESRNVASAPKKRKIAVGTDDLLAMTQQQAYQILVKKKDDVEWQVFINTSARLL